MASDWPGTTVWPRWTVNALMTPAFGAVKTMRRGVVLAGLLVEHGQGTLEARLFSLHLGRVVHPFGAGGLDVARHGGGNALNIPLPCGGIEPLLLLALRLQWRHEAIARQLAVAVEGARGEFDAALRVCRIGVGPPLVRFETAQAVAEDSVALVSLLLDQAQFGF